ncbi:MAG: hypothetical protein AUG07_01715 [Acidobacteria bacterium 13_1_20CM_2_60_10]|nr:MAG: hypothetical protein AUG07_01715 [Acidobacteria bacterium 13_1_20CM_2_60_10]
MAKSVDKPVQVTCPCCHAKLTIDAALSVVLSHEEPPKKGPDVDLTDAQKILAEQQRQREDKFRDSWFEESHHAEKPIRDFDLD